MQVERPRRAPSSPEQLPLRRRSAQTRAPDAPRLRLMALVCEAGLAARAVRINFGHRDRHLVQATSLPGFEACVPAAEGRNRVRKVHGMEELVRNSKEKEVLREEGAPRGQDPSHPHRAPNEESVGQHPLRQHPVKI